MAKITSFSSKQKILEEEPQAVSVAPALAALVLAAAVLVIFGLVMLYSASFGVVGAQYFRKQLMWATIGLVGGAVIILTGYRNLVKYSPLFLLVSFLLLLVARFGFAPVKGAYRWIRLGPVSIQASEFAKLSLALFLAKYCSENIRTFSLFKFDGGLIKILLVVFSVCAAIIIGKDFGMTVLTLTMSFATLLAAGLFMRYLVIPLGILLLGSIYIYFFDAMRLARVTGFLHSDELQSGSGYQLELGKIALGSGNWFGVGFLESRMKAKYLPEHHTDFILSIVGEELGFVGILFVIICYLVYGIAAVKISCRASDRCGSILGFALVCSVTIQALINLAVVSGSAPTKGMSAPFLSYGGSNMLTNLFATALLASIALDVIFPNYSENIRAKIFNRKKASSAEANIQ